MKRAGEIFSGFCIVAIICIHLVMFFKPFEWQQKAAEKIDYQALFERLETEKRASDITSGFGLGADFDSAFPVSGQ